MASLHLFQFQTNRSKTQLESIINKGDAKCCLQDFINFLQGVQAGVYRLIGGFAFGAVQSSATLTVDSTGSTAPEIMTICNVVFTARASGATGNEFNVSATPATQAANMAAAINASANLAGKVTATALLGVVTVTAVIAGLSGNGFQISEGLTNVALVAFASGSNGDTLAISEQG